MTVVQSAGTLATVAGTWQLYASTPQSLPLYEDVFLDYGSIWRTQPNVRTVTGFLARNIGQIGLHAFRRVSDDERRRLSGHPITELIRRPNPWTTRYRWINALVHDLAIYDNHVALKVQGDGRVWLMRVRPWRVKPIGNEVHPDVYRIQVSRGGHVDVPTSSVVHLRGYNPVDERWGVSPMETLRSLLAEDIAASRYREKFWSNAARMATVVKRPVDAPQWSDMARRRFKTEFEELYSGTENSGRTAILEEGMDLEIVGSSMRDAQYLETRKLTREEVAAAFFIPPAMIGILEHANFANIREQHQSLYQDTLAPWLAMIEQDLELQLLPDVDDDPSIYLEFNIAEKLKGSFEDQAQALQAQVGAPVMTRNEGRARLNLPPVEGGDELITPLNVLVGGLASPRDTAPPPQPVMSRPKAKALSRRADVWVDKHRQALEQFFSRQAQEIRSHLGAGALMVQQLFDRARWDTELAEDLYVLAASTAGEAGQEIAEDFGISWDLADTDAEALRDHSAATAAAVNEGTETALEVALAADDVDGAVDEVLGGLVSTTAPRLAVSRVTAAWNQGRVAAGAAAGAGTKTWRTTSSDPRSTHSRLNGETVGLGEPFSNGAQWPGDPSLPTRERANCECTVVIGGS